MTTAVDLRMGQRVRLLGKFQQRRVTVFLTQSPVALDGGSWCVVGRSARVGKRGNYGVNVVRILGSDETVEVVE